MTTFASGAAQVGKTAIQVLELYLDKCQLAYAATNGHGTCPAVLGTSGVSQCFNTRATCQAAASYSKTAKVYRFSTIRADGVQQPGDPPTFPTLLSATTAPTIVTPGAGLGVRATLSAVVADHPWTDRYLDPYLATRSYTDGRAVITADNQGSFWGKFITRNKYYLNRRVDVLSGFLEADGTVDYANLKRRTYILTRISGPGVDGRVTIEAADPLRLADGEKAKHPSASQAKLTADILAAATTMDCTDPDGKLLAWWTDSQRLGARTRYIRIQDEIMAVGAATWVGSVATLSSLTRSSAPAWYDLTRMVAANHNADETVQPCWLYDDSVADIVYDLLANVAMVPVAYLPLATWAADLANGFSDLQFRTLISEPVAVKDLLDEIGKLGVLIYWSEPDAVVYLKGLRFFQLITNGLTDDLNIIKESISVTEDSKALMTEWWLFYDIALPTLNKDLLVSYRACEAGADLDKESADEYQRPAITQVKTRWLDTGRALVATHISAMMLRQYREIRKAIAFVIDPKDATFWVGDTIGVTTKYVQDIYGRPTARNYLVTQMEERLQGVGMVYAVTACEQFSFSRLGVIAPPTAAGVGASPGPYSSATTANKNHYAFIGYNGGALFPDGTQPYQIQ